MSQRRWSSESIDMGDSQHRSRSSSSWHNQGKARWLSNRRLISMAVVVTLLIGTFSLLSSSGSRPTVDGKQKEESAGPKPNTTLATVSEWDALTVLNGPPTQKFRDSLKRDQKYITTFISAGWTNDVMTYINLIYLAILTERIPIVAPFSPSHIGPEVPPMAFGEVFDVPRLRKELKMHVLEWNEVKLSTSEQYDGLGCWNTWEVSRPEEGKPRDSPTPALLKLDLSYTKAPGFIRLVPNVAHELFLTFSGLASLAFPEAKQYAGEPLESQHLRLKLPPDDQLMCYDYLYFASALVPMEYDHDFSPAWRFVGRYLHWTPRLKDLADQYVRRTLETADGEATPAWITVHVRHGDFANICRVNLNETDIAKCFAPLSAIARRVEEVKAELLEKKGLMVEHVIMTSDEKDEGWWEDVKQLGWKRVDHSETGTTYGPWYPIFIDAIIQSGGMGFVGTDQSTMSIIARRRVETWNNGAVRTVKWGTPSSDNH